MEVRSDSDYADIPTLAKFSIDAATARKSSPRGLVKAHGLYKVEKFDYRVTYLMHDPTKIRRVQRPRRRQRCRTEPM